MHQIQYIHLYIVEICMALSLLFILMTPLLILLHSHMYLACYQTSMIITWGPADYLCRWLLQGSLEGLQVITQVKVKVGKVYFSVSTIYSQYLQFSKNI